jgi:YD repeat-containing protein
VAHPSVFDANGNTVSDASGKSYTWDFENRLAQAVVPGTGGGTTTFKYDLFGRRIQKSGPLGTTNYLYDGMAAGANVIEEVDSSGNLAACVFRVFPLLLPSSTSKVNVSWVRGKAIGTMRNFTKTTQRNSRLTRVFAQFGQILKCQNYIYDGGQ